jgi:predicted ribonuclease YlaK
MPVNHRVESVRDKSEKVIRIVKECRRRAMSAGGKLSEGAPLVKGVCDIIAIATEPDMEKSLPWLDKQNNDDRLLAGVIEVMRLRPRSPVFLVSRDINLQNKADFANVPYVEPPDPK